MNILDMLVFLKDDLAASIQWTKLVLVCFALELLLFPFAIHWTMLYEGHFPLAEAFWWPIIFFTVFGILRSIFAEAFVAGLALEASSNPALKKLGELLQEPFRLIWIGLVLHFLILLLMWIILAPTPLGYTYLANKLLYIVLASVIVWVSCKALDGDSNFKWKNIGNPIKVFALSLLAFSAMFVVIWAIWIVLPTDMRTNALDSWNNSHPDQVLSVPVYFASVNTPVEAEKRIIYPADLESMGTGIYVHQGETLQLSASGSYVYSYNQRDEDGTERPVSVTLGPSGWDRTPNDLTHPDPNDRWRSNTSPMGELMLIISKNDGDPAIIPIGNRTTFSAPRDGWLYLTTNSRKGKSEMENKGTFAVTIRQISSMRENNKPRNASFAAYFFLYSYLHSKRYLNSNIFPLSTGL